MNTRPADLATSLLLAATAVAITAAVVFATGKAVLPATAPEPTTDTAPAVPTVDDLSGSQAILTLTGDHTGRQQLDTLVVGKWNEGISPDQPLELSLTYRSKGVSLLIAASHITASTPATGDAASAVIGIQGANYFANDGECTITLEWVDYEVLEPLAAVHDGVPRGVPIPIYGGTIQCEGIKEVRTERHIDLHAVFQHHPEQ